MHSAPSITADMWLGLSAILSLVAAGVAWGPHRQRLARTLLLAACTVSLIAIILVSKQRRCGPLSSATVAVAAISATAGLWGISLLPANHRVHLFTSVTLGLALGVYLLAPRASWACTRVEGWWFGLGEMLCVLSAGALVLGSICLIVPGASSLADSVRLTLALALLCQTACLVANGIGAQLAWGAYWSWDPVECWRIASWLVTALACVSLRSLDWDPRRARWAFLATTGFALATLLGALPLVGSLRLGSLYLSF